MSAPCPKILLDITEADVTDERDKPIRFSGPEFSSEVFQLKGEPAVSYISSNATAVSSLSTATEAAFAAGNPEVAEVFHQVVININNNYYIDGDTVNIRHDQDVSVEQTVDLSQSIQKVTNTLEKQGVEFFDCKREFDSCMAAAAGFWARRHCQSLYLACLASKTASVVKL